MGLKWREKLRVNLKRGNMRMGRGMRMKGMGGVRRGVWGMWGLRGRGMRWWGERERGKRGMWSLNLMRAGRMGRGMRGWSEGVGGGAACVFVRWLAKHVTSALVTALLIFA